jgi:hypothetical protein
MGLEARRVAVFSPLRICSMNLFLKRRVIGILGVPGGLRVVCPPASGEGDVVPVTEAATIILI